MMSGKCLHLEKRHAFASIPVFRNRFARLRLDKSNIYITSAPHNNGSQPSCLGGISSVFPDDSIRTQEAPMVYTFLRQTCSQSRHPQPRHLFSKGHTMNELVSYTNASLGGELFRLMLPNEIDVENLSSTSALLLDFAP
jgi:hypothetical protein